MTAHSRARILGAAALLTTLAQCSQAEASSDANDTNALFTVQKGTLDVTLTENGSVVAKESQKLTFKIRGNGRITFLVPEGSEVAEEEVVCRLDTTELTKRVEDLELQLLTAETELTTNKTNLEIQEADNVAKLEKARNDLAKAKKELERYVDGDAPQELRKLKVELKDAETTFNRANKQFQDSQELIKLNYIKQTDLEDDRISFEKAQVNKEGAELAISLFEKYTRPMTTTEREIAVRDAERAMSTTTKRAESELLQKQVAVTQAQKRVDTLKQSITEKKEDIENMTLKAPCPGFVLYGDPREPWYNERIKIGGNVWEGTTLMTIPDLRVMLAKLEIHEADINKVKQGQKAVITMDTYPGLLLEGEVTKVAQIATAESPWESGGVKKFDVEVTITSKPDVKLKPGISSKVEIQIDRVPDATYIPLQCVYQVSGQNHCRVKVGENIEVRKIEIGVSSDKFVQVTDGLTEGDRVLLYNPDLPGEVGADEDEPSTDGASDDAAGDDQATTPDPSPK